MMIRILALGDSLTAGYGLAPEDSFASRLEQALDNEGWDILVINGGVSGDTARDGLRRLPGLMKHEPDLVIVQFGANDLYAGLAAAEVRSSLERIMDICLDSGASVLLAGIKGLLNQDDDWSRQFQQVYEQVARSRNIPLVPDFMPGIPGNPDLTLADGLHPGPAGVDIMVANILPLVRSMLKNLRPGSVEKKEEN
ncbi:arylesterase [Desulfonatronovibrio hydrogenovorans]|uniref:arylesterase n=1 Tax=Desulfonatronovibrio hydrogenovorans TaxID=53245 RepID=UPI00054CE0E2|nr:arylesterase [Desulfonatronovibrio hydrogenovorans]